MLTHLPSSRRLSLTERAARYLSAMPPAVAGQRGHDATYAAAHAVANGFALDEETAFALLFAHYNARCQPPWTVVELRHKVRSALANPGDRPRGYLLDPEEGLPVAAPAAPAAPNPKWPTPDLARIAAIVANGPRAVDLTTLSPGPLDPEDAGNNCEAIVRAAFADAAYPDPLLCIGENSRAFDTRPLSEWLADGRLAEHALIVPARMTARTGKTREGKVSAHTLANTGQGRFVVVEFDFARVNKATGEPTPYAGLIDGWLAAAPSGWEERDATRDACAALVWHLDKYLPLALAVHTGGKGMHGWFPVAGQSPAKVQAFMREAARLGADPALFRNRSQFVRLPAGTREGGCRQSVFYYTPDVLANAANINLKEEDHRHE